MGPDRQCSGDCGMGLGGHFRGRRQHGRLVCGLGRVGQTASTGVRLALPPQLPQGRGPRRRFQTGARPSHRHHGCRPARRPPRNPPTAGRAKPRLRLGLGLEGQAPRPSEQDPPLPLVQPDHLAGFRGAPTRFQLWPQGVSARGGRRCTAVPLWRVVSIFARRGPLDGLSSRRDPSATPSPPLRPFQIRGQAVAQRIFWIC